MDDLLDGGIDDEALTKGEARHDEEADGDEEESEEQFHGGDGNDD